QAAESAHVLATLRQERQRVGFSPLPVGTYLRGLARAVGIELAPHLSAWGIAELSPTTPAGTSALARLCRRLGISARAAAIHLGLSLAESLGAAPGAELLARTRSGRKTRDLLGESEAALNRVVRRYGAGAAERFAVVEAEVRTVYAE